MATTVEELNIVLSARIDGYNAALDTAKRATDRRLSEIEGRFSSLGSRLKNSVSSIALGLGTSFAAAFSVQAIAEYADTWTRVTRSLAGASDIYGIVLKSGEEVAKMAIETRSSLDAVEKLYVRTAAAASKLGISTEVAAQVTTTFAKALKLGSANTAEQASVMIQFSQALQKGKLDGDEFRSIMENAGVVQQALIEKFKVSGATLIQMAHDGKIAAKDIIAALQQIKPKIDEVFNRSAATVSEAWENLKTALTVYVGKLNEAEGGTRSIADALQLMARNIENIGKGLGIVATVLGFAFAPEILIAIGRVAAGLFAAATGGSLLVGAMFALGASLLSFEEISKHLTAIEERGVTVHDVLVGVRKEVTDNLSAAVKYVGDLFAKMADDALDALMDIRSASAEAEKGIMGSGITGRDVLNKLIGVLVAASYAAAANIKTLFGVLPAALVDVLNKAIGYFEVFVNGVNNLGKALSGVSVVDALEIPRIPNVFAGASADVQALWKKAAEAMGRDYITEMGGAAEEVRRRILDTAEFEAGRRKWRQGTTVTKDITPPTIYPDPLDKHFTDAMRKLKEHTETILAEARAVGLGTAEKERAHAVQELLNKAKEKDIAITPQLLAQMDELARAYGNARGKLELLQAIQGKREDTEALQREVRLTGLYGEELYRARVEAELLAAAKKAGVAVTPDMQDQIAKTAKANAAMQQLNDTISAVRDTSRSALSGFINDLRAGKSGAEALAGALNKIGDKLVDMAVNGLVEAALGPLFRGAGSGGGGGLLSIFGFADGGVMTPSGPRALNRFAGGGVSRSAAIFGEAGPEAAVPLPDGRRIPVELRLPDVNAAARQAANGGPAPVTVNVATTFHLSGSVSAEDLARVKSEVAQAVPRLATAAVDQAMQRRPGFGRRGA